MGTSQAAQAVGVPEHALRNSWARHKGWRKHPMLPLAVPRGAAFGRLFWNAAELYTAAGMIPERSNTPVSVLGQHLSVTSGADPLQAHLIAKAQLSNGPHAGESPGESLAADIAATALILAAQASRARETLSQIEDSLTPAEWSALNRAADEFDHATQAICRPMRWQTPSTANPAGQCRSDNDNARAAQ